MADTEPVVALLAGASGFLGARVLDALLDAPEVALAQADARAEETGTTIDTVHGDVVGRQPTSASYDLLVVADDVTALGRHGPPDHGRSPTGEAPDVVVLAWATRRIA